MNLAALMNLPLVLAWMLRQGATVDPPCCTNNMTPLMLAARHDYRECAVVLLEAGADRMLKYRADNTAAGKARKCGHLYLAEMIDRFKLWHTRHAQRRQAVVSLATVLTRRSVLPVTAACHQTSTWLGKNL